MADPVRLYNPNPDAPQLGLRAPEPLGMRNALANALSRVPGPVDAVWGALPPEARNRLSSLARVLADMSPGAAVRDTVDASGNLTNALARGDTWGSLGAGANMLTAMAGVLPGMRAVSKATPGMKAPLRLGPGRYAEDSFPVGDSPADLSMYSHLPAGKDTEAREQHIARAVFDALREAMGYKAQGGSKWSNYAKGPGGEDLRVSNHPPFNPGSMGVDDAKRIGVQISEGAQELTLTSPEIRRLYGGDITFPLDSGAFETLTSPQSIARLKALLESGSH